VSGASATAGAPTPSIARRLACFVYEAVLLFGVVMVAGWLYSTLTQQRHAMTGRHGLQGFLFVALAIYFVSFWSRGGQTVAMKTWHIRLVDCQGEPISQWRALTRYLLAWLWFLPALAAVWLAGLHDLASILGTMAAGVIAYAMLAWLHPDRQFWHDSVCGTRLITWRPTAGSTR
jgi:uncharacterized RDD family membrane protein YckC